MAPPPRRLLLRGKAFAFHGISRRIREQWTRVLTARGATVLPQWRDHGGSRIAVLTDWYVDTLPDPARTSRGDIVFVTEYWLRESLRLGEWLELDTHPFFSPPAAIAAAPLLVSYPMDYNDEKQASDNGNAAAILARLPCSPLNLFEDVVPLWPYIVAYLNQPTSSSAELAAVLKRITGESRHPLNCLTIAIDELLNATERAVFFQLVLPTMKQLVLELPFTFRSSIRLLTPIGTASALNDTTRTTIHDTSLHLSRAQLLPLLSAMFLSVFPAQSHVADVEFPWFNMEKMFSAPRSMPDFVLVKAHKIRTILEYFLQVVPRFVNTRQELEQEVVTFTRVAIRAPHVRPASLGQTDPAQLSTTLLESLCVVPSGIGGLSDVRIETNALIEDLESHLQIDFANKYAGGGVMNGGAVQEEIRFIVSPELMVACLVFARLEAHESFAIHGSERFSNYTGYGGLFRFGGSTQDTTPFQSVVIDPASQTQLRRRQSVVVGIDAISYGGNNVNRQYSRRSILRDLMKALVGFALPSPDTTVWPIATGNWGCGVFRGDPELKFLIQWLAASLAGRDMVYVIFEQTTDLQDKMTALLQESERFVQPPLQGQSQQLAQWLLEFMMGLEADLLGPASPGNRVGRLRSGSGGEGRERRLEPSAASKSRRSDRSVLRTDSVLERALEYLRTKIVKVAGSSASCVPPARSVSEPASNTSSALEGHSSTSARTSTTLCQRKSDTANGNSGRPQLKQRKLSAFWQ